MYVIKIIGELWSYGENLENLSFSAIKKGSEYMFVFKDNYVVVPCVQTELKAFVPLEKIF